MDSVVIPAFKFEDNRPENIALCYCLLDNIYAAMPFVK
jgi:hypothetical protein